MTDRPTFAKQAEKTFAAFSRQIAEAPHALPAMLSALDFHLGAPKQIVIAGAPDAPDTRALLRAVHARFLPNRVLLFADGGEGQRALARHAGFIAGMRPVRGAAAAYICEHGACQAPVTDPAALDEHLHR